MNEHGFLLSCECTIVVRYKNQNMNTQFKWSLLSLSILLSIGETRACESIDWDFVYHGQQQALYWWILTLLVTVPNLVLTLRLSGFNFWFLIVMFPATFHPFVTMSPFEGCGYTLPEEAPNYFYYSIPLLIINLIRLYRITRKDRGIFPHLMSI